MRLFVAISLPDVVKRAIELLQQPIEGIRWNQPRQYHITLRFIGEVSEGEGQAIQNRLTSVQASPFELDLTGMGCFPKKGYPRVLWVGVEKSNVLGELQSRIEQVCRDAGLEPETREFKPHLTLGKVKGASKQDVNAFIERHKQFRVDRIPVSEFVLYSSRLRRDGALHEPQEHYPLSPQGDN